MYGVGSGEESTCRAALGAKDLLDLISCVIGSIALDRRHKIVRVPDLKSI